MTNPKHSHSDSIILPGTDTSAAWTARGLAATLAAIQLVATWPAQEHGREGAGTAPLLETFPGCCTYHFCSHPELGLMPHEILRPGKRLKSRQSSLLWRNGRTDIVGQLVLSQSRPATALRTLRAPPGRASPQALWRVPADPDALLLLDKY